MRRRLAARALLLAFALLGAGACRSAPAARGDTALCPLTEGEFPPTDCAFVVGRALDAAGQPLSGLIVRVDSFVPGTAYAYASDTAAVAPDGSFRLLVHRVNRLQPPASPDTATVEIKLYQRPGWRPGAPPVGRAPVRMRFAPLGTRVDTTAARVVIAPP